MKLLPITRRKVIIIIILISAVVCAVILSLDSRHRSAANTQNPGKVTASRQDTTKTAPDKSTASDTSSAPTPAADSLSPACQKFTLEIAQTILGSDAAVNTQDSAIISDDADMQTSSCAYRNNAHDMVYLSAFIAKSPVGESMNTTVFGSEKPIGVQDIPGYGQAAYWDANRDVLSILKNNNRYELSRSSNSLDNIRHAADSIVPKL